MPSARAFAVSLAAGDRPTPDRSGDGNRRSTCIALGFAAALALGGCGHRQSAAAQGGGEKLPALVADATPPATADAERDAELTKRVRRALDADAMLAPLARRLTIVTLDGQVTLRGDVPDAEQRRRLAEVARGVPGVREVHAF